MDPKRNKFPGNNQKQQPVRFTGMISDVKCVNCGVYGHENSENQYCDYAKKYPKRHLNRPIQIDHQLAPPTLPKLIFPSNLPPRAPNAPRPMHASYIPFGPVQEAERAKQYLLMGQRALNINTRSANVINQEFYTCRSCKLQVHVSSKATRCPHLK